MKYVYLFILISLTLGSCKESIQPDCCDPLTRTINLFFSISDQQDKDLLNQNNENTFKIQDIKVFEIKNNQEYYINGSNEASKLIKLQNDTLTSYHISLSTRATDHKIRTLFKWNTNHIDTVDLELFSEKVVNRLSKIYVNGKEMLDTEKMTENKFLYRIHLIK